MPFGAGTTPPRSPKNRTSDSDSIFVYSLLFCGIGQSSKLREDCVYCFEMGEYLPLNMPQSLSKGNNTALFDGPMTSQTDWVLSVFHVVISIIFLVLVECGELKIVSAGKGHAANDEMDD